MKKIVILVSIISIISIGGYIYLRSALNTNGFTPVQQPEAAPKKSSETFLDLRPKLILKLQQLVKEGSNGLYNLSVREIEPDILNSKLDIMQAMLIPDTIALKKLDSRQQAPDDVFKIKIDSLHIDGIGIKNFLAKDNIDLKTIFISAPFIEVFHKAKAYNKNKNSGSQTAYQRLMKQMKHIAIDKIVIDHGTVADHNLKKKKTIKFNDVNIQLKDILIDSTTQFDKSRFVFAKQAEMSTKNFVLPTNDGLYDLKAGSIAITATNQQLKALNVELKPLYNKQEFSKHIKVMQERYDFSAASLQFKNISWWNLINGENINVEDGEINSGNLNIYLDLSLPQDTPKLHNFPHQLLMKLPFPVKIDKIKINDLNVSYEEYHPKIKQSGKLFFDKINGTITNITNIPSKVRHNHFAVADASGILMHQIPMHAIFQLDLAKYKTGVFSADVNVKSFDGTILNSIAEPLGLFLVKHGRVQSLKGKVDGDNYNTTGKVLFLYDSLHLTPLKMEKGKPGEFKKQHVFSFIANAVVLKNQNPSGNKEPRNPDATYKRDPHSSFFNLIWKTILVGILKTIGAPEKLAY